jgi:hypothetical protein
LCEIATEPTAAATVRVIASQASTPLPISASLITTFPAPGATPAPTFATLALGVAIAGLLQPEQAY